MKYWNYDIVMREVPNEITLAINITNCPCHCIGCHSPHLSQDIGEELTEQVLEKLANENSGITCIAFMGGDSDRDSINRLGKFVHNKLHLKVAWYSGRDFYWERLKSDYFDYVKYGHYDKDKGPLNKVTTNQVMVKIHKDEDGKATYLEDITHMLQPK